MATAGKPDANTREPYSRAFLMTVTLGIALTLMAVVFGVLFYFEVRHDKRQRKLKKILGEKEYQRRKKHTYDTESQMFVIAYDKHDNAVKIEMNSLKTTNIRRLESLLRTVDVYEIIENAQQFQSKEVKNWQANRMLRRRPSDIHFVTLSTDALLDLIGKISEEESIEVDEKGFIKPPAKKFAKKKRKVKPTIRFKRRKMLHLTEEVWKSDKKFRGARRSEGPVVKYLQGRTMIEQRARKAARDQKEAERRSTISPMRTGRLLFPVVAPRHQSPGRLNTPRPNRHLAPTKSNVQSQAIAQATTSKSQTKTLAPSKSQVNQTSKSQEKPTPPTRGRVQLKIQQKPTTILVHKNKARAAQASPSQGLSTTQRSPSRQMTLSHSELRKSPKNKRGRGR